MNGPAAVKQAIPMRLIFLDMSLSLHITQNPSRKIATGGWAFAEARAEG
jgi:hypothetical protein